MSAGFTREAPCPVCGGHQLEPRGKGVRCFGFRPSRGGSVYCTREERAGALPLDAKTNAYRHRLVGLCGCGVEHAPAPLRVVAANGHAAAVGARRSRGDRGGEPGRIVRLYAYRDEAGAVLFETVRYQPKTFKQRRPDGHGGWVWSLAGVRRVLYRLPELLAADPDAVVWLCEGEKDADALAARGLVATTNPLGAGKFLPEFVPFLAERHVVVLPDVDADGVGQRAGQATAALLDGATRSLRVLELVALPATGDVSDWFANGGTVEELRRRAAAAPPWTPDPTTAAAGGGWDRPILIGNEPDLREAGQAAWRALSRWNEATGPVLFRSGGQPRRLEVNDLGRPITVPVDVYRARDVLARAARWVKVDFEAEGLPQKAIHPPLDVVRQVLAMESHPLPVLTRMVEAPVFGRDGSLQTAAGYHRVSQTFYAPPAGLDVPAVPLEPSADDVARARALLLEDLLGDFPFQDVEGGSDRAHAVAALLLPFARDLIAGPTPGHMIEAPGPGSGKGLLAEVVLAPAVGGGYGTIGEPTNPDEWAKVITTALMESPPAIWIDNVSRRLESGELARAITSPAFKGRILGSSTFAEMPVRCLWLATANNPTFSTEMARRFIRCRINPPVDRPYLRDVAGFRHPQLAEWAREHRGELIWSALVLIRSWLAAGRPTFSGRLLGSFERWSAAIGGVLEHAGIGGFLGNLTEHLDVADAEGNAWREFVAAWWEKHRENPVGVDELLPLALGSDGIELGRGNDKSQRTSLGMKLGRQRDRVFDDLRIVLSKSSRQRGHHWRLLPAAAFAGALETPQPEQIARPTLFDASEKKYGATEKGPQGPQGPHFGPKSGDLGDLGDLFQPLETFFSRTRPHGITSLPDGDDTETRPERRRDDAAPLRARYERELLDLARLRECPPLQVGRWQLAGEPSYREFAEWADEDELVDALEQLERGDTDAGEERDHAGTGPDADPIG